MKKIIAGAAIAALSAGLVFADNPAINVNVVDFTGNAAVQWGVDLDSGKTGFKNSEYMKFSINLFDAATRSTEADGDLWAELVIKAGNTKNWNHRLFNYDSTTEFNGVDQNADLSSAQLSFDLDVAKFHYKNFFVGIQNGDTLVGEFKPAVAINGDKAWLSNVGGGLITGITEPSEAVAKKDAGYEEIKANDDGYVEVNGKVYIKGGTAYKATAAEAAKPAVTKYSLKMSDKAFTQGIVAGYDDANLNAAVDFRSLQAGQYTSAYAIAAEAALKDANEWVTGLDVKLGGAVNLSKAYFDASSITKDGAPVTVTETRTNTNVFGYTAQAGYKLSLDDTYYVKPMVGYTGQYAAYTSDDGKTNSSLSNGTIVGSVLFGWGAMADANAGVYFLDGDSAKKVTPGISVAAEIPLATVFDQNNDGKTSKYTYNDVELVKIIPSFYSGTIVPNLKAAAYAEITMLRVYKEKNAEISGTNTVYTATVGKNDNTMGLAVAAGLAYDVKVDAVTVTPKAGIRFANDKATQSGIFADMGYKGKVEKDTDHANWLNLKLGCDVAGLINNTTFFVNYVSANLLNDNEYKLNNNQVKYNVKAGTLNVGTKISF